MEKEENNNKFYASDQHLVKVGKKKNLDVFKNNSKRESKEKTENLYNLEALFNTQPKKIALLKGDNAILCNQILEKQVNNSIIRKSKSPTVKKFRNSAKCLYTYSNDENSSNVNMLTTCNTKPNKKIKNQKKSSTFPKTKIILEKIFLKGTKSLSPNEIINKKDINNPYIYSYTDWNPYSFCTGHKKWGFENGKLKSPSPTFLENEEWCKKQDMSIGSILHGINIDEEAGLILVDPFVCAKFTGILSDLIKQFLKAVFGHKISLNVKLFEPTSLTQTLTSYFSFAPKFLLNIADIDMSPVERMKNVVALGVSGLYMNAKQLKPFNPLISETFQGYFDLPDLDNELNRIEVFSEQTSNYPTVTRYYIKNELFKIYGYWDLSCEMKSLGNKIICYTKGYNTIDFCKIDEKIIYNIPSSKVVNAIAKENRSAHYVGAMVFVDIKNSLRAFVQFCFDKKHIAKIRGYIFKYNFPMDYKFNFDKEYEEFSKIDIENNDYFDSSQILSVISGSWLDKLFFDGNKYWDIHQDIPTFIQPCLNCLPSDVRFREDLIWLYRSFYCSKSEEERIYYEKLAQNWKLMVEKVQREEREYKAKFNAELAKRAKK